MMRRLLLVGALFTGACAGTGVSDKEVARLPVQDRAQLVTATSKGEAFNVVSGATSGPIAGTARSSVELGRRTRDDHAVRAAMMEEDAAKAQVVAVRAKVDYAERLIDLREAKIDG